MSWAERQKAKAAPTGGTNKAEQGKKNQTSAILHTGIYPNTQQELQKYWLNELRALKVLKNNKIMSNAFHLNLCCFPVQVWTPSEAWKKINELKTKQKQMNTQKKKKKRKTNVTVNEHCHLLNTKSFFVAEYINWRNLMKSFPKNLSKFGNLEHWH